MSPAPVGDNETLESPLRLEHVVKQVGVLAGVVAIDAVVRAHDGGGIGDGDADVEGEQIGLLHAAPGDDGVDEVTAGFLVVHGVVLDVANDVLRLLALHEIADDGSGEERIFAGVFEGAAVAGLAGEVDCRRRESC